MLLAGLALVAIFTGLAVDYFGMPVSKPVLVIATMLLTFSIDLIRLYNQRAAQLLTLSQGIQVLSSMARRHFKTQHSMICRLAKMNWAIIPKDKRQNRNSAEMEKVFYQSVANADGTLSLWTSDLLEMAARSIASKQTEVAKQALAEVSSLTKTYIEMRKNSFVIFPDGLGVFNSNSNTVISPIIERLQDLSIIAFDNNDELAGKYIATALGETVSAIMSVEAAVFKDIPYTFHWLPISYLQTLGTEAIERKQYEVGLDVVRILNRLLKVPYPDSLRPDLIRDVIEKQAELATKFHIAKQHAIAEQPISGMMSALQLATKRQLWDRDSLWKTALSKLQPLVLLALGLKGNTYAFTPPNSCSSEDRTTCSSKSGETGELFG